MAFVHTAYLGKMNVKVVLRPEDTEFVASLVITPDNTDGWRSVGEQSIWLTADDLAGLRESLAPPADPETSHLPTEADEEDWLNILMS